MKNVHHMYQAYGGWTFAFIDYYRVNFTQDVDSPETQMVISPAKDQRLLSEFFRLEN